jgi:hypothetical protein
MCLKKPMLNMDKYGLSSCGSSVFGIKCAPKFWWSVEIPSKFVMNGCLGLHRIFRRLWALGLASKGLSNLDSRPRVTSVQPLKPALHTHDTLMIKHKYIYIIYIYNLYIYIIYIYIIYIFMLNHVESYIESYWFITLNTPSAMAPPGSHQHGGGRGPGCILRPPWGMGPWDTWNSPSFVDVWWCLIWWFWSLMIWMIWSAYFIWCWSGFGNVILFILVIFIKL